VVEQTPARQEQALWDKGKMEVSPQAGLEHSKLAVVAVPEQSVETETAPQVQVLEALVPQVLSLEQQ